MIQPAHDRLSISTQCRLLTISRSSYYYAPVPETQGTLALMRVTAWIRYGLGLLPCDDHCKGKVMRCLAWLRMIARSTEPRQRRACAEAMKSFTSAVLLCWA